MLFDEIRHGVDGHIAVRRVKLLKARGDGLHLAADDKVTVKVVADVHFVPAQRGILLKKIEPQKRLQLSTVGGGRIGRHLLRPVGH